MFFHQLWLITSVRYHLQEGNFLKSHGSSEWGCTPFCGNTVLMLIHSGMNSFSLQVIGLHLTLQQLCGDMIKGTLFFKLREEEFIGFMLFFFRKGANFEQKKSYSFKESAVQLYFCSKLAPFLKKTAWNLLTPPIWVWRTMSLLSCRHIAV